MTATMHIIYYPHQKFIQRPVTMETELKTTSAPPSNNCDVTTTTEETKSLMREHRQNGKVPESKELNGTVRT